ncbi:MAG: hypothetical protein AB7E51_03555 [Pseudodesulfovibrio sp.]|uniref:Uncharacterized protein n=1 Tax=Pseudodesulfovibrio indicus TaxID=1716143 RepID=A0A126QNN7_9BACT|nr:hypothetical protein [Pseudodesulfovibrio indicus]AMK11541.1 hypothetical protein AWY79_10640 [Pseudodesulfovibrio indicus]TDT89944.1 hypothetical protein EDC59_103243 [Pseudodesulfovibrio indicus]
MPDQTVLELIEYLEKVNAEVKRIEAEGEAALASSGQDAFRAKLEEKAKLLAGLAENSWELVERVEGELGDEIAQRMERFSMSASTALRIGSVFFMTALLYPEDHKPGDPNDLEAYIGELRGA